MVTVLIVLRLLAKHKRISFGIIRIFIAYSIPFLCLGLIWGQSRRHPPPSGYNNNGKGRRGRIPNEGNNCAFYPHEKGNAFD
jgi:hypothetical protein